MVVGRRPGSRVLALRSTRGGRRVADSADTPEGRDRTGGGGRDGGTRGPGAPDAGSGGDGGPGRRGGRRWLRWGAAGACVLLLAAGGVGWGLYSKLDHNISQDERAAAELRRYERERPENLAKGAQNVLLIGSDSRAGENGAYGKDVGTQRSDTTILLHVSAKRDRATAVSLPRDLMVAIPACRRAGSGRARERFAQFNWAFENGGTACTVRTVEKLTNIRVDHYMVVDFEGFKKMVDAVGGVRVCLPRPIDDREAHVRLGSGAQNLDGEQALGYVRARKSLGDGSDTDRMDRQQRFLASLVAKMRGGDVLFNPAKLYPVLDAATSSLTTDSGLASLRDLYELVRGLRSVPPGRVRFMTVPRESYVRNPNRDQLRQPDAGRLFEELREDAPVTVDPSPSASPSPSTASPSARPSGVRESEGGRASRRPGAAATGGACPTPRVKE
ncbi:LCP family protein [Streptomyces sp. NPDC007088]|uniref:LCP family protein n=1 Tax=Streptomyces sp. NPDC007088 TaxID=3364773 RepID=UPI00369F2BB0